MMAQVDFNTLQSLGLAQQNTTATEKSKSRSDMGQDDFLKLMVTQLNNQDPMKPMESGDFLGQIAQFSTVTGIEGLQTSFSEFASTVSNDQGLQAANLVGRKVSVPLQAGALTVGGTIDGELVLPASSSDVFINITDQSGQLIRSIPLGTQSAGPVAFSWDGKFADGTVAPPGLYNVDGQARIDGQNFELDALITADVESVTLGGVGKSLQLNLSELGSVPFSNVSRIF